MKTFLAVNFGCRVNAAETNQFSQTLVDNGYIPFNQNSGKNDYPDLIFINTCAITKKGEYESVSEIKRLAVKYPQAKIVASGCAQLEKISQLPNFTILNNPQKEIYLKDLKCAYSPKIGDKFSHTHRFLLKIQSGCTQFCSYCTVPFQRRYLWSLPIDSAIDTVNRAVADGYREVIITGVNIDQYQYGLSELLKKLISKTEISLISFGSLPINSIDSQFVEILKTHPQQFSDFLHIPIQSGSDKILKLMHRPYTQKTILEKFKLLNSINSSFSSVKSKLKFGTDIIVGFPGETEQDFQATFDICQKIGFSKIHTFRYSPRPNTAARQFFLNSPKLSKLEVFKRSKIIRSLNTNSTV